MPLDQPVGEAAEAERREHGPGHVEAALARGPRLGHVPPGAPATVNAAIGALIRKIQRQSAYWTSAPPTNGPSAAAMLPSPVQAPMARPRSLGPNDGLDDRQAARREQGAADALEHARRDQRARRSGASPHTSEATANQTTPITNTRRRPSRSPSAPPSRIRLASVSR